MIMRPKYRISSFINERNRGRSAYDVLYSMSNNPLRNEDFLRDYFENI